MNADLPSAFLAYIAARELRVPRLRSSGQCLSYASRPPVGEIEWTPASGHARLVSYTVLHGRASDAATQPGAAPGAYNVAWVELAEGPRLVSTVHGAAPGQIQIGMPLQARFEDDGRLVFVPAAPHKETA